MQYNMGMKQYQNHSRDPICTIDECDKKHLARGYCLTHYTRWRSKGSAEAYSKAIPNTFRVVGECTEIDLRNVKGEIVGVTFVDSKALQEVIKYRWCMDSSGYAIGRVEGKLTRLHKLILKAKYIDHKDRNKLNNISANLRPSTHKQNSQNHAGHAKTSNYKGVSFVKAKKWVKPKWAVYSRFPKSDKRFWGYYPTELEAAKAYNRAAKLYGDDFTYLNKL